MPVVIREDRTDLLLARLPMAADAGLEAEAEVYRRWLVWGLERGYTTGAFVTGRNISPEHLFITPPEDAPNGGRQLAVVSDLDYPAYWEAGHDNLFTREYEREEVWGPAIEASALERADVKQAAILSLLVQGPA